MFGHSYFPGEYFPAEYFPSIDVIEVDSADSVDISITDSSILVTSGGVEISTADSVDIVVTEVSEVIVFLSQTDTVTLSISDDSDNLFLFDSEETITIAIAETASIIEYSDSTGDFFFINNYDTITVDMGEADLIPITLSKSDSFTLGITETSALRKNISRTDNLQINIGAVSLRSIIVPFSKTDSFTVAITEDSLLVIGPNRPDTVVASITESSFLVKNIGTHSDAFTLGITETSSISTPGMLNVTPPVLTEDDFFPPIVAQSVATLLPVESAEDMAGICEFLWYIHPELYKEPRLIEGNAQKAVDRYRGFLRSIDGQMCSFREFITNMLTFIDPTEAPYFILPYLSLIVGIDFNYDIPEEFARAEIANAIFLWERKGTRDNLKDWIRFLTGFPVRVREFYKEVIRRNVYGQSYPDNTLPRLNEHHNRNTWANEGSLQPWPFIPEADTNYGRHGYTDTIFGNLPGFLFRNHVGLYLDIEDFNLEESWFDSSFFTVLTQKIEKIIDLVVLYGTVHHIFYRIITTEVAPYIIEDSSGAIAEYDLDEEYSEVASDGFEQFIENPCAGRFVDVYMCTNESTDLTNTTDHWFRYAPVTHYMDDWVGDVLYTYDADSSMPLIDTAPISPENSEFEQYVLDNMELVGNQGFDGPL